MNCAESAERIELFFECVQYPLPGLHLEGSFSPLSVTVFLHNLARTQFSRF